MLLTLLKAKNTSDLQEVIETLAASLPPLDIFLMLEDAELAGDVSIDRKKNKIKALREPDELYYDAELLDKIVRMIKHYDRKGQNITRGRLDGWCIGEMTVTYPMHNYLCTMYAFEQGATSFDKPNKYEINVPEIKNKRPPANFIFYTYFDHQECGAKAVNEFIDQWAKKPSTKKK